MVVREGRCYAEKPLPILKITAAETIAPFLLRVQFNNGECRLFDGHTLLDGEAFAPLADVHVFSCYQLDYETLTWLDASLDIAPEFVYENSSPCASC